MVEACKGVAAHDRYAPGWRLNGCSPHKADANHGQKPLQGERRSTQFRAWELVAIMLGPTLATLLGVCHDCSLCGAQLMRTDAFTFLNA